MSATPPVVIVGAGWAGLATAVHLVDAGVPVVLLEATRSLGGRARSVHFGDIRVDNGQHVLLGAYRSVLELLARVGVAEDEAFVRLPLILRMRCATGGALSLRLRILPPPAGLALGLLATKGLGFRERVKGVWAGARLLRPDPKTETVAELLERTGQPTRVRRAIWEPLCLAALNTPADSASARVFTDVLRSALLGPRGASDLLLPRRPLESLLPEPAAAHIRDGGGQVRINSRVRSLRYDGERLCGVMTDDGPVEASQVVLAAQPRSAAGLLHSQPTTAGLAAALKQAKEHDITTVYFRYGASAAIDPPLQGLVGCQAQWLVDRRSCGQHGVFAAVVSASDTGKSPTAAAMAEELTRVFPELGSPEDCLSVRERRATFAATSAFDSLRPKPGEKLPGLFLAGDWTATGLPGTLEGAVVSGQLAASDVIEARNGRMFR